MSTASLVIALIAVCFSVGSAWWLYGYRGKLVATNPPRFGFLNNGTVLRLRVPLAIRNTGGRTLVVQDLRCWFPNTDQVLSIPWRHSVFSLHEDTGRAPEPPLPFAVRGHDAFASLIEFGCPFPGVPMEYGNHAVEVEVLAADRLEWIKLVGINLLIDESRHSLTNYEIYENLPIDLRTAARANSALLKLIGVLRSRRKES